MTVIGTWALEIRTPIGRQHAVLEFSAAGDDATALTGVARSDDGDISLRDVALDGGQLTWSQSITRPMKLDLRFDVTVSGDTLAGTSKAGRLPASAVTGTRIPAANGRAETGRTTQR